ncbi:DUF402 domain-containing protein [Micromonospora echinospora]|uniref:DUF402 domain-containing protein n=1 Tax=Micromonospora echinospora TaxID=1877 RepID=UPI003439F677
MDLELRALTHDGRPHLSWAARAVSTGLPWTVVRCDVGTVVTHHTRKIEFALDQVSVGLFTTTDSFNIFNDYDVDGHFVKSYINVASPLRRRGHILEWNDYHLDVLVASDGGVTLADIDEFDAAVRSGAYSQSEEIRLRAVAEDIRVKAAAGRFPFLRGSYDELLALMRHGEPHLQRDRPL